MNYAQFPENQKKNYVGSAKKLENLTKTHVSWIKTCESHSHNIIVSRYGDEVKKQ